MKTREDAGRQLFNFDQFITRQQLDDFKNDLIGEIRTYFKPQTNTAEKRYLKSADVKKMLGISSGTLQNLRIRGKLKFTRVGRLIFYSQHDVENLMLKGEQ